MTTSSSGMSISGITLAKPMILHNGQDGKADRPARFVFVWNATGNNYLS